MLDICVPWLEVIGNVRFNVSSELLQAVCGWVLCGVIGLSINHNCCIKLD